MKNSRIEIFRKSFLLSLVISMVGSVSAAEDYMYTGRDKAVPVNVGSGHRGQPAIRTLELINGRYYSKSQIELLDSSTRTSFAGYGVAPATRPATFEDRKEYQYAGRTTDVEFELGHDRWGKPITRRMTLRNGGWVSGEVIKKLKPLYRDSFILRAIAPVALVATVSGLTPDSAMASEVRANSNAGSSAVRLKSSNTGSSSNSLEEEIYSQSNTRASSRRPTVR